MIMLDINVLWTPMQKHPDTQVVEWLDNQHAESIWISRITLFEARYGPAMLSAGQRQSILQERFDRLVQDDLENRTLQFDADAATQAAQIAAKRKARGRPVDMRDTFMPTSHWPSAPRLQLATRVILKICLSAWSTHGQRVSDNEPYCHSELRDTSRDDQRHPHRRPDSSIHRNSRETAWSEQLIATRPNRWLFASSKALGRRSRTKPRTLNRITLHYRKAYGLYACNGILFNHECPLRGSTFVTRKITHAMARIALGLQDCLYFGNLSALRDWSHAKDYVEMQWLMLQQDKPDDFVIATGVQCSVREFVERAAVQLGITIGFGGEGKAQIGSVIKVEGDKARSKVGDVVVNIDRRYYRPTEIETLLGDPSKAKSKLGWVPKTAFKELVREMSESDFQAAKRDSLVKLAGVEAYDHRE